MIRRKTNLKRSPLQRSGKLRPVSAKRAKESRIYTAKRKAFLAEHRYCQWFIEQSITREVDVIVTGISDIGGHRVVVPPSVEIHHRNGRSGTNYLDQKTWMAVSRIGHDWIHQHPKEARARGWLRSPELMKARAAR